MEMAAPTTSALVSSTEELSKRKETVIRSHLVSTLDEHAFTSQKRIPKRKHKVQVFGPVLSSLLSIEKRSNKSSKVYVTRSTDTNTNSRTSCVRTRRQRNRISHPLVLPPVALWARFDLFSISNFAAARISINGQS